MAARPGALRVPILTMVAVLLLSLLGAPEASARSTPIQRTATHPAATYSTTTYTAATYTVVHGDSIRSIGTKLHRNWQDLASWNKLLDPYRLTVGQRLRTTSPNGLIGFRWTVHPVTAAQLPYSYRAGCPVPPSGLRMITMYYYGFDARAHMGRLVVAAGQATKVVRAFNRLYLGRFPIQRMQLVDTYRGSDDASMAANNTSAFNCRRVTAGGPWSEHAYGAAVDLNTVQNPYVSGSYVAPTAGRNYLDRSNYRRGMVSSNGLVDSAFTAEGWKWGGDWSSPKDYQHFSANGR